MLFEREEITSRVEEYVSELFNVERHEPPEIDEIDVEDILVSETEEGDL